MFFSVFKCDALILGLWTALCEMANDSLLVGFSLMSAVWG